MFELQRPWIQNLDELQREMERYLNHLQQRKPRTVVFTQRSWRPAVDVYETQDNVVAVVDLPGVSQEEIQIVVARDSLTIQGQRLEPAAEERTYSCIEIPFGPYERTVGLPSPVSPDGAAASYRNGFLQITMPKLSALQPQRVSVHNG